MIFEITVASTVVSAPELAFVQKLVRANGIVCTTPYNQSRAQGQCREVFALRLLNNGPLPPEQGRAWVMIMKSRVAFASPLGNKCPHLPKAMEFALQAKSIPELSKIRSPEIDRYFV